MQIETDRLILKAATQEMVAREFDFLNDDGQKAAFVQAIGARVGLWPHLHHDTKTCSYSPEKLTANPHEQGWRQWYILRTLPGNTPLLIGTAGFHGPPDATGSAEIGYGVLEEYQRQGIAPETVKALTAWAFNHADVTKLIITTLDKPEFMPSSKVAQKCGFHFTGTRKSHEGTLLVYELLRQEYDKG
jgi:RimJ/RimL family protein N-acetyltransferase